MPQRHHHHFDPHRNAIGLFGFAGSGAGATALAKAMTGAGITTVSLPVGTRIMLRGAPTLTGYNFF